MEAFSRLCQRARMLADKQTISHIRTNIRRRALTQERCSLTEQVLMKSNSRHCYSLLRERLLGEAGCRNGTLIVRHFHTSGRREALPPLIWGVISFCSKMAAALTGRRFRNWLNSQPSEVRKKYMRLLRMKIAAVGTTGVGVGTVYYYCHLQETPITGRKRFITLTRDQYLKVAEFESENFLTQYKDSILPATHPVYTGVVNVAMRIVKANQDFPGMDQQKWVIHVVKRDEKNAFVLPNGHIFVFTGLLDFMQNEDQFAVVLGHEMSHALLLHAAEQLSYTQFLDYFVIGVMAAIWTVMPNDGIAIVTNWFYNRVMDLTVHMPYSRTLEKEADRIGLQLAAKACFDVREGSVLWNRMSIVDDLSSQEGKQLEFLSTHPTHDNRVKTLNKLIPKALDMREGCNCPKLPAIDPREKVEQLRSATDNIMIAKAAKANLQRLTDTRKPIGIKVNAPISSTK